MKPMKASLGIIFYKNRIAVCQFRRGRNVQTQKSAEFTLPTEQADLRDLMPHADRFKSFLKENNFGADKAVVGLDAGRVFSLFLNLTTTKDQTLAEDMIRIQLERKTQLDMEETAFGYITSDNGYFVAAVLKKQMDQIKSFLLASGIRAVCITAVSLAVESAQKMKTGGLILEYPESIELVLLQNGQFTALRDIPSGSDLKASLPRLRQEVNRYSLTRQVPPECMFLLSSSSAFDSQESVQKLFDGATVQKLAGVSSPADILKEYARQMAEKAMAGEWPSLNFLASLQPHKKSIRFSRWMPRAITAAVIGILLIFLFALEWHMDRRKIADYKQQLESIGENVKQAQAIIDRTAYARQWFDRQPVYLKMLTELTRRFPEQGGIWLNSLAVDESLNQIITGKASGERAVLDVVDNLKSSPLFQDVKILYIRQAGKNSKEETFAISFRFIREN
jgi:Tfp pilus assembly protein PilN